MKRISKTLNVIGILTLIIVFITKEYSLSRLIELLLGVILLEIAYIYKEKRRILSLIIYPLVWLVFLYFIDFGFVYFFKYEPVLAKRVTSSEKVIVYNSLLYREFKCENKKHIDLLYLHGNYCESNLLEEKDINIISSNIINSFDEYKNKFYIITGKVSFKEGNNKIELKSYNSEEDNINGNVIFNDNIVYELYFKGEKKVDDLKLYDNIKIVGRIASIKNNKDTYVVSIKDAYIVRDKLYDNYKINVVETKKCEKDKTNYVEIHDKKYYTSCLSNIYVVYDEDEVYELSYVLKDEKIKLEDLLKDYNELETKKVEEFEYQLYKYDNYNILMCDENNIIIGNEKLDLENNYCEIKDLDNEEL